MTTQPTTAATATQQSASSSTLTSAQTVDKNMFLKLLSAQMQNQDPMAQQQDSSQWMAQMAQFTELEQISNLASSDSQIASSLGQTQALSLIGKTVTYLDSSGASQSGVVTKVDMTGGKPLLQVGSQNGIEPSTVTEVQ